MPERNFLSEGLLTNGLEAVKNKTDREIDDFPEQFYFPGNPAEERPDSASIRNIFPASELDAVIEGAIAPVVSEKELLLPTHFSRVLAGAHQTLVHMCGQAASPVVLAQAVEILARDEYLRELARIYRNALYQA